MSECTEIDTVYCKTPDEVLDYVIDWTTYLGADTISSDTWIVENGITVDSETEAAAVRTIWLSGGTKNTKYKITNQIITAAGRTAEQSFWVHIGDK